MGMETLGGLNAWETPIHPLTSPECLPCPPPKDLLKSNEDLKGKNGVRRGKPKLTQLLLSMIYY